MTLLQYLQKKNETALNLLGIKESYDFMVETKKYGLLAFEKLSEELQNDIVRQYYLVILHKNIEL